MRIEILEKTIKQAPYGIMHQGEVREVDETFGAFACANGWARDVAGQRPTGERGKLDRMDPQKYRPGQPAPQAPAITPDNALHQ